MIHQLFIKVREKEFHEFPIFVESSNKWREYCKKYNLVYKLWFIEDLEAIMSVEHFNVFYKIDKENRDPFLKVDYGRVLILNTFNGCYVDLDIFPKENFFDFYTQNKNIIGSWIDKKGKVNINNNILKFEGNLPEQILEHYREQYEEKSKIEIYKKWKKRFIFQTFGPKSLKRFCDKNNLTATPNLHNYIEDRETQTWLD